MGDDADFVCREGPIIRPRQSVVDRAHKLRNKTLIGKLHTTDLHHNQDSRSLIEKIRETWSIKNSIYYVTYRDLGNNFISFTFEYEEDKVCIMDLRPWSFFGYLLVLTEWQPLNTPVPHHNLAFFTISPFWVQAHDLPWEFMSEEMGMDLGKAAGQVLDVETEHDYGYLETENNYLRIRVNVDITKRLALGCWLYNSGDQDNILWISFRYEGLPKICYRCGLLGHVKRNCRSSISQPLIEKYINFPNAERPVLPDGQVLRDMTKRGYGPWIYDQETLDKDDQLMVETQSDDNDDGDEEDI